MRNRLAMPTTMAATAAHVTAAAKPTAGVATATETTAMRRSCESMARPGTKATSAAIT